jgi:predicted RNase H-like HicB family nuclease
MSGYTVILVPNPDGRVSASVPAMPGCFSVGDTREQALTRIGDAMALWSDVEADSGRAPLQETPAVVASAVSAALEIIDDMRRAGELPNDTGYHLELVTVHPRQRAVA